MGYILERKACMHTCIHAQPKPPLIKYEKALRSLIVETSASFFCCSPLSSLFQKGSEKFYLFVAE